jgi:hypothetical protein
MIFRSDEGGLSAFLPDSHILVEAHDGFRGGGHELPHRDE